MAGRNGCLGGPPFQNLSQMVENVSTGVQVLLVSLVAEGAAETYCGGGRKEVLKVTHDAHLSTRLFHFTPSNHGHITAVVPRYVTCPTMTCLGDPSRVTQWRSKPVHTMEIQAGSKNGDPKPVRIMEIQVGSHNGDPSRFTQWRSKPVHTMEIQISSQDFGGNPFHITWPLSSFALYLQWKAYV